MKTRQTRTEQQVQPPRNTASRPLCDYLRVSRVAEILDTSRTSIYDLIRKGEIKGIVKIGGRLRIPRESIDDLIRRGTVA